MSASTAVKWVQRKRETGSVEAKPVCGHPPAKLLPHKDRLLRLIADEPSVTLKRIGGRLAADGIHVSKSCLHSFLWRKRTRLKKTARAAEQNRPDVKKRRAAWRRIQLWIDPARLVFLPNRLGFLDATGFTTKMTRHYGQCPIGERLVSPVPHGH